MAIGQNFNNNTKHPYDNHPTLRQNYRQAFVPSLLDGDWQTDATCPTVYMRGHVYATRHTDRRTKDVDKSFYNQ
jgi:hypothetical protein